MDHFFPNPRESRRIVGKVIFDRPRYSARYYAVLGESIQGAFCTLPQLTPGVALWVGRDLSEIIMGRDDS